MDNRSTARGHWPKGRRRNNPGEPLADVRRVMRRVAMIADAQSHLSTHARDRSRKALARWLGVQPRTVRRWIALDPPPPARELRRIRQWIARFGK